MLQYIVVGRFFKLQIMKAHFEIQINYETSPIEIDEDVFKEGFNEIIDLFYSYYKIGIIPRIGEELIPKAFDVPVTIKSICYCEHKIMIDCDFSQK